ncbi:uncharacterized protein LOC110810703 isoform X2 [Carica papaya]|uniref:uncharacterized protein LOC110810703 isoform X2 n=1 Tax=Carica papaya TaxID=3649 RepID=UPI000B8CBCDE|nr:uncharacterized protein LOC110810703 isoform X2 [Carica papaya]XP_021892651.1 uncharacterized protein LOC110810703 isoform X2 [Carica papaya]XP_021892652.1 uncharacterized protein LOC110810703 isoform X2 [Carica papaya]
MATNQQWQPWCAAADHTFEGTHGHFSLGAQEPAYQQIKRLDVMVDVVRMTLGTGAMDELIHDEKGGVTVDNDGPNIMKILFANRQVQGLREYIIGVPVEKEKSKHDENVNVIGFSADI